MDRNGGERPLLGTVLVQHGAVTSDEVEEALNVQEEKGDPIGEILLESGAVCRPILDRALAAQRGVELHFERGFGSGLRERIEHYHRLKRGLAA